MQAKLGTFSTGTDQPDLKGAMGTATGISILRDNAVGRMGPSLWLGTEMDVEQAYQLLELEQANPNPSRYKLAKGRMGETAKGDIGYTMAGVKALLKCDIRNDLIITPVEDSWMPVHARASGSKPQGVMCPSRTHKIPKEIQALAADAFSISASIGGWSAEQREPNAGCSHSLQFVIFSARSYSPALKNNRWQACKACGTQVDPAAQAIAAQTGQPWPVRLVVKRKTETVNPVVELVLSESGAPVDMLMDNHAAFIDFYTDWFVSDEGREASSLLRKVIHRRTQQALRGQDAVREVCARPRTRSTST